MNIQSSRKQLNIFLLWLCLPIVRLFALLPYRSQMSVGRGLARLALLCVKRRKNIVNANLNLCFPSLSPSEKQHLLKQVFLSTGMGAVETIMAWWMPDDAFKRVPFSVKGFEHIKTLLQQDSGIIVIGAHFACLEIIGRYVGKLSPYHIIYKQHKNTLFERMMTERRLQYASSVIDSRHLRAVIKKLRAGKVIWYCPDQDFGPEMSIMAPFFNVPTATLNVTGKLAKMGRAAVVPVFFNRSEHNLGYEITFCRPLNETVDNDSDEAYTLAYNALLEAHVKQFPSQYHWMHRRFKTRPEGEPSIYTDSAV